MKCINPSYYFLLIALVISLSYGKPFKFQKSRNCGYQKCNKAKVNELNVHLVPHSHDDVGWLKTVDQYFYGTKNNIQRADVNRIITSVVIALKENPERHFIQVETAFFYKWWQNQPENVKKDVHKLVNNGQLEFVGGAWSMNDEGAVHYHSIIDQFTFGLKFLNDTFGECARPRIGWQIDPFGHSSEMATIFAQMEYDGLFFARLDWRDKTDRMSKQQAEMIWRGSASLGNASDIFTSVLYNHYSAPKGFCFDLLCNEEPIITNEDSTEYNYKTKVQHFSDFIRNQAKNYKTNNILITMGDDFNYQDALYYYRNIDTLINGFRVWPQKYNDLKINVFYSTPSCYVKAVNDAVNSKKIKLPLETNDFFPYATDYHAYWSGYFTSRPASKHTERKANNLLQIHKQLAAFSEEAINDNELFNLQNAVGIMQHHDAITGTEKQHVADDYARILHEALVDSGEKISKHITKLLTSNSPPTTNLNLKQCLWMNVTVCPETNSDTFTLIVYNPIGRTIKYPIRIPVNGTKFEITGPKGNVKHQISPSIGDFSELYSGTSKYELTFIAEVPPLGIQLYRIRKNVGRNYWMKLDRSPGKYRLSGKNIFVNINSKTGLLQSLSNGKTEIKLKQELLYYLSAQGDNSVFHQRASGAYIFRSQHNAIQISQVPINITTYKGELFDETHQVFSSWARQIIRLYKNDDHVEFEWLIGPIPVDDRQGKEIISRISTDLDTNDEFYTDSNGREMLRRIRNYRPTYNYTNEEPIAGNYYPVTSQITITDGSIRMNLLNDRSEGGSSLRSGQIELMLHRRMLHDDAFGVGEALNEREFGYGVQVRGRHFLTMTNLNTQPLERHLANKLAMPPWVFISTDTIAKTVDHTFAGLTRDLPEDIHLLTLEPLVGKHNELILRLENLYPRSYGKKISISLTNLFTKFDILTLRETNLAANAPKEARRMVWQQYSAGNKLFPAIENTNYDASLTVTLSPMQIRTFIIYVKYK